MGFPTCMLQYTCTCSSMCVHVIILCRSSHNHPHTRKKFTHIYYGYNICQVGHAWLMKYSEYVTRPQDHAAKKQYRSINMTYDEIKVHWIAKLRAYVQPQAVYTCTIILSSVISLTLHALACVCMPFVNEYVCGLKIAGIITCLWLLQVHGEAR